MEKKTDKKNKIIVKRIKRTCASCGKIIKIANKESDYERKAEKFLSLIKKD